MILDIHTHHPAPDPEAVICVAPAQFAPVDGQLYSVGIHPWSLEAGEPSAGEWEQLERAAAHPRVAAIGETGIDLLKGGPLFRQLNVLKRHIELSERIGKPLILHCVRAHDHIAQLRRAMKPSQPWAIHGFRGKPAVARILLDAGCRLSLGPKFNPAILPLLLPCTSTPVLPPTGFPDCASFLLAETDDSGESIAAVITALAAAAGLPEEALAALIAANTASFLALTPYEPGSNPARIAERNLRQEGDFRVEKLDMKQN